jgi:hypothetical protein
VRRLIPFYILAVLTVAAGVFAFISYQQANDPTSATMLLNCSNKYGAEPSSYVLACADYNAEITHLHWTSWGNTTAYATGVARWNDCTPDCADGHWKSEPATLWAWGLKDDHYTRLDSSDALILPSIVLKPYPL